MKKAGNEHGVLYTNAVIPIIRYIQERRELGAITRVPPRGDTDNLGAILKSSVEWLDKNEGTTFSGILDLGLIRRTRDYPSQKGARSFENRARNVRGAFSVQRRLDSKHVLLFDDIITSEHTAAECSRALLCQGASHVTVLALGFNQGLVLGIPREVPCSSQGCGGHLVMRFNQKNHGGFWGCSNYFGGCKSPAVVWLQGLRSSNSLNSRDDIRGDLDVDF